MTLVAPITNHLHTEDFAMPALPPEEVHEDPMAEMFASLEAEIRGLRLGCHAIAAVCDERLGEERPLPTAEWDDQSENGRRLWYYRRQIEDMRCCLFMTRHVLRAEVDDPAGERHAQEKHGRPAIPEEYVVR